MRKTPEAKKATASVGRAKHLRPAGKRLANSAVRRHWRMKSKEWNEELNDRRCNLIDKKYSGDGLTEAESEELDKLQARMLTWRRKVAPLPLNELRKLHAEVMCKVAELLDQ